MWFFIGCYVFEEQDQLPTNLYLFDKKTFKLHQIRSTDNSTYITINHTSNEISDNTGNILKIFYNDNSFINELQLYKKSILLHSVR